MTSRQVMLLILGLMFMASFYFKAKIMKLMKQVKEHQLIFGFGEIMQRGTFESLITDRYPEHAELLTNYRLQMRRSLLLMGILLATLVLYSIYTIL